MHPCKSYWVETNINAPTTTKSKKAITLPKLCGWLLISNLTLFYNGVSFCKLLLKSMHPCKSFWSETNINTPTKLSQKKGHNSAKIWWMITNIELDPYFLQRYKVLQGLNEINASLQKLLSRNEQQKRLITNIELDLYFIDLVIYFICVEILRPSQPNRVMSSVVSLPNHTFNWAGLVL